MDLDRARSFGNLEGQGDPRRAAEGGYNLPRQKAQIEDA